MTLTTSTAEEIQRQMRRVRTELGDDVQDLMASAKVMTDWHSYVRAYPWLCVGAAAVAGYLIVPGKTRFSQPDAASLRELVQNVSSAGVTANRPTFTGMVTKMAVGYLLQGGLSLLTQQLQRHLQNQNPPGASNGGLHHD